MINFDEAISVETPERLNAEQLTAVAELPAEAAAVALGTSELSIQTSRMEMDLASGVSTPFIREDVETARKILLSLALSGSSEAIQYRAACKILDDATVKAETRFRSKAGMDQRSTVNNIIVAVNKAKSLSDSAV